MSKVYEKKSRTKVDLKQNIREEVAAFSPNMLQQVMQNFQEHFGECVDNKGRHLTGTIFRK
jgi:carbon monoxide dehydrogenase subunit G